MANSKAEYAAALGVWDALLENGDVSAPVDQGAVAILCPYVDRPDREELDEFPAFRREALQIADSYIAQGTEVNLALHAGTVDFKTALSDPGISSIVLIGHGCLASVEVDEPATDYRLDWKHISEMADHLKAGSFIQRVCGTLPRSFNAPIGLLAVQSHNLVEAPVGNRFMPKDLADEQNGLIRPVTDLGRMEYMDIKREFPQRRLNFASRTHVALGALKKSVIG